MPTNAPTSAPELLYLVHSDPDELEEALQGMRSADIAEALRDLPSDAAAKVMAALPFATAVQVFDDPELTNHRHDIVARMDEGAAVALIEAMSADSQADLFRELDAPHRERLLKRLSLATRDALAGLLTFDPHTAGGIMTTEFMSLPSNWTADAALAYVREVGRAKETIYAIYLLDATTGVLTNTISLRELMLADPAHVVADIADKRNPITVRVDTDREDVARVISKYNLLAVPVVNGERRVLGIVTVDDVIDAIVREQTEDAQKFGGMEALDAPYMEMSFGAMVKKRAGWLCALFLSEMLTATAMQHYEHEIEKAVVLSMFIPLIMSSGGNSGSQATS
ncbi:MAG: magnesium transporter, partial [bacterium]